MFDMDIDIDDGVLNHICRFFMSATLASMRSMRVALEVGCAK